MRPHHVMLPLLFVSFPVSVDAQAPKTEAAYHVTVTGRVVDAQTGTPVQGAAIAAGSRSAMTDSRGRFSIQVVPGPHVINVTHLGYDTLAAALDAEPGVAPDFPLTPRPAVLQAIGELERRIRSRRNASSVRVQVLDRRALFTSSHRTAADYVVGVAGNTLARCGNTGVPLVTLAIDGRRAAGGLDELASYPPQELYLIEIHGGRHIRAFTAAYVEQAVLRRVAADPEAARR